MFKGVFVGVLLALSVTLACKREGEPTAASGGATPAPLSVRRGLLLASGLGGIDGVPHSNSLEALRCNHRRGFRWFEADLTATAEGELVCFHKGDEKLAHLPGRIWNLTIGDLEGKKYADRFAIVRFSSLLAETDKLGDVVLVLDTEGWSKRMQQAVSRSLGYGPKHATKIVLQVYGEKDIEEMIPLSKELGAGLLLNLNDTDDAKAEELVKKTSFLAVVARTTRFTPWLAERLHAARVPVLVQTVNEHRDIVNLSRAGADGFFTDTYLPYEGIAADPSAVLDCDATKPSPEQLHIWSERSTSRQSDYRLPACGKRSAGLIELSDCDERAALRSNLLAVPTAQTLHVELDAEAGNAPANFWLELTQKKAPKAVKPRELISLKAKERRTLNYDVELPQGSPGVEARLGLVSKKDALIVHRLVMFHGEKSPEPASLAPSSTPDAGE
jgi:glycerophosphoryl diester phosphodiesterase